MTILDRSMNRVALYAESNSFIKSQCLSRAALVVTCLPLEVMQLIKTALQIPFQAALTAIKMPAKVINLFVGSPSLREFENQLSGPLDMLKSAFKIVGIAISFLLTASLGIISPGANFRLHVKLGLVVDEKAVAMRKKVEQDLLKQREEQWEMVQLRIQNLILAQRLKNSEKEHALEALVFKQPAAPVQVQDATSIC